MQTTYYNNGNKRSQCMFVNGSQHGLYQRWYENGQKESEGNYVNGYQHGLSQWWYENGQKQWECTYVNGVQHGLNQWWREDGHNQYVCTYVNGKLHGLIQWWHPDGSLTIRKYCIHDTDYCYDDIQRADSRILLFKRRARMLGRDTLPSLEEMLGPEEDYTSTQSWTQFFDLYKKEREPSLF
jgi:hypothetical protein